MGKFTEPFPAGISYFLADWQHDYDDEPMEYWFEVNQAGEILRGIEVFKDGSATADAVSNYEGGKTEFAIGSLSPESFWESEWDDEPTEGEESLFMQPMDKSAFEGLWSEVVK